MSSKKSKPVNPTKDKAKDKLFVGVITAEQQRKMRQARERQERVETPHLKHLQPSSAIVLGDYNKKQKNRRARRQSKQEVKTSDF